LGYAEEDVQYHDKDYTLLAKLGAHIKIWLRLMHDDEILGLAQINSKTPKYWVNIPLTLPDASCEYNCPYKIIANIF
jgi:hypothetical protein